MSTVAVIPTADPSVTPTLGAPVIVSFYDADHNVHSSIAHVLSISVDPAGIAPDGEPSLTLAYPKIPVDVRALSGANWQLGYVRSTGVKHVDHPDVVAGKESIAWGGPQLGQPPEIGLPQPVGTAANPIFNREEAGAGQSPDQSIQQTLAVQSGSVPTPTVLSPLPSGMTAPAPSTTDPGANPTLQGEVNKLEGEINTLNQQIAGAATSPQAVPDGPGPTGPPPNTPEVVPEAPEAAETLLEPHSGASIHPQPEHP